MQLDVYYCLEFLRQKGVCVVAGSGFGQKKGTWHFRYARGVAYTHVQAVESLTKGHVGGNTNSDVLSFVERLSSFGGSICVRTIWKIIFGTSTSVLCREVYYTVSLSQRFHCNMGNYSN